MKIIWRTFVCLSLIIAILFTSVSAAITSSFMEKMTFSCVGSAHIDDVWPDSNGQGADIFFSAMTKKVLLQFNVKGIEKLPVKSVRLMIYCSKIGNNGSNSSISVDRIEKFSPTSVTWNSYPETIAANVGTTTLQPNNPTGWIGIDITNAVNSDGTYYFALHQGATQYSNVYINSHSGQNVPYVEVFYGGEDECMPTTPKNVKVSDITLNSAKISWTKSFDMSSDIKKYYIYNNGISVGETTNNTFELKNLQPGYENNITVLAQDLFSNLSEESRALTFTSGDNSIKAPATPNGLKAEQTTSNSVFLKWNIQSSSDFPISYDIYCNDTFVDSVSDLDRYTMSGLEAGKEYKFHVVAKNIMGKQSKPSESVYAKTQSDSKLPYAFEAHDYSIWNPINGGAGGYIAGLDTGVTPGQIWICSDMEGPYRSDDYGKTWHHKAKNLSVIEGSMISTHPTVENLVFYGCASGLFRSDNAGEEWYKCDENAELGMLPINLMAYHPNKPETIYALPNNKRNRDGLNYGTIHYSARGCYFVSNDYGVTWEKVRFAKDKDLMANPSVYGLVVNPANDNQIYVCGDLGLYFSNDGGKSYTELEAPYSTMRNMALSPNGKYLVLSCRDGNVGRVYATDITQESLIWHRLDENIEVAARYYPPVFDPNDSEGNTLYLCVNDGPLAGMNRGKIKDDGGKLSVDWKIVFNTPAIEDRGWIVMIDPRPNLIKFPNPSWPENDKNSLVYTTGGNAIYVTNNKLDENPSWNSCYSDPVTVLGHTFYRGRGQDSTYTPDTRPHPLHPNYVAKTQADNGFLESYDGGNSWRQLRYWFPAEDGSGGITQGGAIEYYWKNPNIIILPLASGYGSTVRHAGIFIRTIDPQNPGVQSLKLIGGGLREINGFPDKLTACALHIDKDNDILYVGTWQEGIYYAKNASNLIENGIGEFVKLPGSGTTVRKFALSSDGKLYASTEQGFYLIELIENVPSTKLLFAGSTIGVTTAKTASGKEVLLITNKNSAGYSAVYMSSDYGKTFKKVLDTQEINYIDNNVEEQRKGKTIRYSFADIIADSDRPGGFIYVSTYIGGQDDANNKYRYSPSTLVGYFVDEEHILWDGATEGIALSASLMYSFQKRDAAAPILYAATRGAGSWIRNPSLIANGSFGTDRNNDSIPDYWTAPKGFWVNNISNSGAHCLKISSKDSPAKVDSVNFKVDGTGSTKLKYWINNAEHISDVKGRIVFDDQSSIDLVIPETEQYQWIEVETDVDISSNVQSFKLEFVSQGSGDVFIDDVYMIPLKH